MTHVKMISENCYIVVTNNSNSRDKICTGMKATHLTYSFSRLAWKLFLNVTRSVGLDIIDDSINDKF